MTVKYDNFIKELQDLCKRHGVDITTSGIDSLQVWDAIDDKHIDLDIIKDFTDGSEEYENFKHKWKEISG